MLRLLSKSRGGGGEEEGSRSPRRGYLHFIVSFALLFAATQTCVNIYISTKQTINEEPADIDSPRVKHYLLQPPEATQQPLSHDKCCIPNAFQGIKNPNNINCAGTCYHETACNNPAYPFTSEEEKRQFPLNDYYPAKVQRKLIRQCLAPKRMTPPVEWCQKPTFGGAEGEKTNGTIAAAAAAAAAPAQLVKGIPPAGCSLAVGHRSGSGAFQHVILFPSAKLAFCGVPKVGITQWEQFLRFYFGAKDYPSLPHYKLDREFLQFDALEPHVQRRIWEGDEWTWAAFIRNPAERLLSAYLDKVESKKKWTFEKFVDSLSKSTDNITTCDGADPFYGLNWCSDPHWRPQVYSCGLSERLDRFDFIGDIANVADQTRELLKYVGLWESHGKYFVHGGFKPESAKNRWCNLVPNPYNETIHAGFQQKQKKKAGNVSVAQEVAYGHVKGARNKMEEFFTPELLKKVEEELYPHDNKLWKLVSSNGNKLSNGKDLLQQLSSKCSNAR